MKKEISEIKPYEKNAKKHPKKQIDALAKIVKEVGWRQPVLVNKDGVIVVGHGRYETWKQNEKDLKPIWVIDDSGKTIQGEPESKPMTKTQEMAYRLADNKLNESDFDMELVTEELKELDIAGFDITLTGFEKDLILEPEEKDDKVPDVPEEPKAKLGDIYQLGENRLMCGSATEIDDVEKLMDGQKAELC